MGATEGVAGTPETPRPLTGTLVKEMERGEEDDLGVWDGGQVELEDVFAVQDSCSRRKKDLKHPNTPQRPVLTDSIQCDSRHV